MTWIHNFLTLRYNCEAVDSKKLIVFYSFFAVFNKHWYMEK